MNRISLNDPGDYLDWREGSGGTVEIFDLLVSSERRVGRGRELVRRLVEALGGRKTLVWAMTRASNQIAREFYQGLSFRLVGVLLRFYDGEDAVLFGKDV